MAMIRKSTKRKPALWTRAYPHQRKSTLSRVSKRREVENRQYVKVKREWKRDLMLIGRWFCVANWNGCTGIPSDSPHHKFGRGPNLTNRSTYLPVCLSCHDKIHRHPALARLCNLLCLQGQWMKKQPL